MVLKELDPAETVIGQGSVIPIRLASETESNSNAITLEGLGGVQKDAVHCWLSVQMFESGGTQIAAAAGSFAVSIKTDCNGLTETPPKSSIDATDPVTIGWSMPTESVTVTPTGLDASVDTWRVSMSFSKT